MNYYIADLNMLPGVDRQHSFCRDAVIQDGLPACGWEYKPRVRTGRSPYAPRAVIDVIQVIVGTQEGVNTTHRFRRDGWDRSAFRINGGKIVNKDRRFVYVDPQPHLSQPRK
jgi:hypothetical protein